MAVTRFGVALVGQAAVVLSSTDARRRAELRTIASQGSVHLKDVPFPPDDEKMTHTVDVIEFELRLKRRKTLIFTTFDSRSRGGDTTWYDTSLMMRLKSCSMSDSIVLEAAIRVPSNKQK